MKGHFLSIASASVQELCCKWDNPSPYQRTDVGAFDGSLWCPKPQANVLVPSSPALSDLGALALCSLRLGVDEDMRLLLVGTLRLHGQFGRHGCGCWFKMLLKPTRFYYVDVCYAKLLACG